MTRTCRWLVVMVLMGLMMACRPTLSPASAPPPPSPTASAQPSPAATPAYLGQFDCYGLEAGTRAYAGRIGLEPAGTLTFGDQTGQWTYDAGTTSFAFTGSTDLGQATYAASDDTLVATFRAGGTVAHADDGRLDCVRARPGITGP